MAIKDRKRTRFNRIGIIRLGYKVFWCKDGHRSHPTRWYGEASQPCEQCGKIKTGISARNTSPFQSDHFVLRDAPDVLAFFEAQGVESGSVRELNIMFPFADRDKNFVANYQVWAGGNIVCEGDGEFVTQARPLKATKNGNRWRIGKEPGDTLVNNGLACRPFDWNGTHFDTGDHVACSGSGEDRLYPHCHLCKLNSMLKVMMADPRLFRMGYYRISTGSGRNYDHLETMFGQFLPPNVQGITFQLRMVEEATEYTDDEGKTRKVMKWFLHLEPDPDYMRDLFAQRRRESLGQGAIVETPQLEAVIAEEDPDWEDPDDDAPDAKPEDIPTITREDANEYIKWAIQEATLTVDQALEAIDVEKLGEYLGDLKQAKAQANQWISDKIAEDREPPLDEPAA